MDTTHSGTWPCEKCGAMFKSRAYLQKHTLIMHQKDEDKPHRFAFEEIRVIRGCWPAKSFHNLIQGSRNGKTIYMLL